MGRLDERVASHPVHQVLEDTRASLDALTDEQRAAMDETGPEGMPDRVVALREFISGLLVSADPRFVAVGMLDGIQNSVAQVRDQLDNVRTVGAQHTPNVDEAIDAALGQAWPLAALVRIDPANAEEAGRQIGALITDRVQSLQADATALREELEALQAARDQAATEIEAEDEARIAALTARAEQIEQTVTAEKQRFDQLLPSYEQQFTTAQAARDTAWQEEQTKWNDELESTVSELTTAAQEKLDAATTRADEILEDAEARRDRVEKLYGLITDKATSGAFSDEANEQKKQADAWRVNAIRLGVLSALVAIGAVVFAALDDAGSTTTHIGAFVVAILLSGLTAYAARQSGSHREREVRAKRLELELTAFGPFTDTMADPAAVRTAYSERLFRGAEEPASRGRDDHVTIAQSVGEGVIELLRGVAKK